jgi:hypothetical protein
VTARLHPDDVALIAEAVVERLRGETPATGLVDAETLARELGVARSFIYAHKDLLGAKRLGGPHGRLRFDVERARAALPEREAPPAASPPRPRARPRVSETGSILRSRPRKAA